MRNLQVQYYINAVDSNNKQYKCTDLESAGWFKSFETYVVIEGMMPYFEAVKDFPTKLLKKESYVKRVFSVKAPKCQICAQKAERGLIKASDDCSRIRKLSLKTSPYVRYFCGSSNGGRDFVTSLADTSAPCYHLISETLIDKEAIFQLNLQNKVNLIRDFGICLMIEERLGINL